MTTRNNRLAAAQADFNRPSQIPTFSISKAPYVKFYIETEIELPIYPPYTKEAYTYFDTPCLRGIAGIEVCEENGNYIVTADSDLSESSLYSILRYFTYEEH